MKDMKHTTILAFTAGSLATAGLAVLIATGPDHKDNAKKKGDHEMMKHMDHANDNKGGMGGMDDAKMMAEMMRLGTPGKQHAELAKGVGSWSAHTSFTMDPSQPPVEGPAKMTTETVLGGRYTASEFRMEFMGQPYQGISYMGYDIAHEQFISIWMDSMSTKITHLTGNLDDHGNLVMTGISTTPMGDNPMKIVTSFDDDNHMTDKFYDQLPDGSWNQSGTITYTRD